MDKKIEQLEKRLDRALDPGKLRGETYRKLYEGYLRAFDRAEAVAREAIALLKVKP